MKGIDCPFCFIPKFFELGELIRLISKVLVDLFTNEVIFVLTVSHDIALKFFEIVLLSRSGCSNTEFHFIKLIKFNFRKSFTERNIKVDHTIFLKRLKNAKQNINY